MASDKYTAFVTGDNFGGGVNAARLIGERLGGRGNVAVLRMFTGTPIDMDRFTGFYTTITREFPDIRIVTQADGQNTRETGMNAMTNILPGFPQIDAVFTLDDETAIGALTAIQNARRTDIRFITGFGGTRPTYELFRANDPVYLASMSYFPSMGFDAVEKVVRILRGIPTPKDTIIASQAVGSWNVTDFWDDSY
jgi:ribose transport system substrate-binding protein